MGSDRIDLEEVLTERTNLEEVLTDRTNLEEFTLDSIGPSVLKSPAAAMHSDGMIYDHENTMPLDSEGALSAVRPPPQADREAVDEAFKAAQQEQTAEKAPSLAKERAKWLQEQAFKKNDNKALKRTEVTEVSAGSAKERAKWLREQAFKKSDDEQKPLRRAEVKEVSAGSAKERAKWLQGLASKHKAENERGTLKKVSSFEESREAPKMTKSADDDTLSVRESVSHEVDKLLLAPSESIESTSMALENTSGDDGSARDKAQDIGEVQVEVWGDEDPGKQSQSNELVEVGGPKHDSEPSLNLNKCADNMKDAGTITESREHAPHCAEVVEDPGRKPESPPSWQESVEVARHPPEKAGSAKQLEMNLGDEENKRMDEDVSDSYEADAVAANALVSDSYEADAVAANALVGAVISAKQGSLNDKSRPHTDSFSFKVDGGKREANKREEEEKVQGPKNRHSIVTAPTSAKNTGPMKIGNGEKAPLAKEKDTAGKETPKNRQSMTTALTNVKNIGPMKEGNSEKVPLAIHKVAAGKEAFKTRKERSTSAPPRSFNRAATPTKTHSGAAVQRFKTPIRSQHSIRSAQKILPQPKTPGTPSNEQALQRMEVHKKRMESARKGQEPRSSVKPKPNLRLSDVGYMRATAAINRPFSPKKSDRKPTVPRGPKLETLERLGDKPTRPMTEEKAPPKKSMKLKLTELEPFKLSYIERTKERSGPDPPTLAEMLEAYMGKGGIRDNDPNYTFCPELTVPEPFHLSKPIPKPLPKSAIELEEEDAAYILAHQFKAKPIGSCVINGAGKPRGLHEVARRESTIFSPFKLSEKKAKGGPDHVPTTEELKALECKNQFHALPMPDLSYRPPSLPVGVIQRRGLTVPEPFQLQSVERHEKEKEKPVPPTPDDIELNRQFHARAVPGSLYRIPSPSNKRLSGVVRVTVPSPPKLATSFRNPDDRRVLEELSMRNAEERAKQRESVLLERKRQEHSDMILASMGFSTPEKKGATVPQPFQFQGDARSAVSRAHVENLKRSEEEEAKRMSMSFRARLVPSNLLTPQSKSQLLKRGRGTEEKKEPTAPQPFQLKSLERHNTSRQDFQTKIALEEEERRSSANVRAKPLPPTTYKASTLAKPEKARRDPLKAMGPNLQTASQAKHRKEFDDDCRKKREEEILAKKRQQDEKDAEDVKKMMELRRLPVSKGGLMYEAKPVHQ